MLRIRTILKCDKAAAKRLHESAFPGTQKGGVENSIENCLTVFQCDPLLRGACVREIVDREILYS